MAKKEKKKGPVDGGCVDITIDKKGRKWIAEGPSPFPRRVK